MAFMGTKAFLVLDKKLNTARLLTPLIPPTPTPFRERISGVQEIVSHLSTGFCLAVCGINKTPCTLPPSAWTSAGELGFS